MENNKDQSSETTNKNWGTFFSGSIYAATVIFIVLFLLQSISGFITGK
jgi:hypothetical protein